MDLSSAPDGVQNSPGQASDDGTYLLSRSPVRQRNGTAEYKPKIISTIGQRPACLVSATVTYVGNDEIYAFGGFDQYTDEVYNHVLRLNLTTRQWSLVDNYGDIPGVRMGHTATLWNQDKVLIFGGENEHRSYLNDLIVFDLKTAHWQQPDVRGSIPQGRARHAAVIHDDKLYIVGGMSGRDNSTVLDDFCYLDLRTWEWSRTWRFVPRYDHTCWVWQGKIWVFGGLTQGMQCANDIWTLDPKKSPAFEGNVNTSASDSNRSTIRQARPHPNLQTSSASAGGTGYAANSSSVQTQQGPSPLRKAPMAPGTICTTKFTSGPNIPSQNLGQHFHVFSSGCLLDFATPPLEATNMTDTSLSALELDQMRWEKLAEGNDLFNPSHRWHYCAMNQDGTDAWLLGTHTEPTVNAHTGNEYLSDVLHLDLSKFGLLGNGLAGDVSLDRMPASDAHPTSKLSPIGADLAAKFDLKPEAGGGADFMITADGDDAGTDDSRIGSATPSRPIHVHRFVLEARWPHFANMINAQMAEFHSKKLHLPEPFPVVRAFLYYLYTDSIAFDAKHEGPTLNDVAGMLVLADCYDMQRLRLLCRNRLGRELDIDHAAMIFERAGLANEDWLRRKAARFCLTYWGRVVRTPGFLLLKNSTMAELCQEIDPEGRVVGADELELVGGLSGARFGTGEGQRSPDSRPARRSSTAATEEEDVDEDDMDLA